MTTKTNSASAVRVITPAPLVQYAPDSSAIAPEEAFDYIRRRAYELYEERGRIDGRDVDDWMAAEREWRHHPGPTQD